MSLLNSCKSNAPPCTLSNIKTIGAYSFQNCTGLTGTLDLPSTLTTINSWAFNKCTGITEVNLPESLTLIGGAGFEACTNIAVVNIPSMDWYVTLVLGGWSSSPAFYAKALTVNGEVVT